MDSLTGKDERDQTAAIASALEGLWAKFLPEIRERVAVLERAAAGFAANTLTDAQREEANSAAHKLAGTLGTFGLTRGTVLARELELMYTEDTGPDAARSAKLAELTVELKGIVEGRKERR
jgi:HPt (histidine-containing phosphotransfer) domain-containing protein